MNSSSADLVPRDGFQEFEGDPNGWVGGRCGYLSRDPHTGRLWVKRSGEDSKLNWVELNAGPGTGPMLLSGIGPPEGIVAAPVGSIYSDIADPQHPVLWQKTANSDEFGWFPSLST